MKIMTASLFLNLQTKLNQQSFTETAVLSELIDTSHYYCLSTKIGKIHVLYLDIKVYTKK